MTDEQFDIITSLLERIIDLLESIDTNTGDISRIKNSVADIERSLEK